MDPDYSKIISYMSQQIAQLSVDVAVARAERDRALGQLAAAQEAAAVTDSEALT